RLVDGRVDGRVEIFDGRLGRGAGDVDVQRGSSQRFHRTVCGVGGGELAPGRDRAVGQRLVDGFGQGDGDPAAGRGVVVGDTHERGGGQGGDLADRVVAGDLNQVTAGQRAPRRE